MSFIFLKLLSIHILQNINIIIVLTFFAKVSDFNMLMTQFSILKVSIKVNKKQVALLRNSQQRTLQSISIITTLPSHNDVYNTYDKKSNNVITFVFRKLSD